MSCCHITNLCYCSLINAKCRKLASHAEQVIVAPNIWLSDDVRRHFGFDTKNGKIMDRAVCWFKCKMELPYCTVILYITLLILQRVKNYATWRPKSFNLILCLFNFVRTVTALVFGQCYLSRSWPKNFLYSHYCSRVADLQHGCQGVISLKPFHTFLYSSLPPCKP